MELQRDHSLRGRPAWAELRCWRCFDRYPRTPTYLGKAYLDRERGVLVDPVRRIGKRAKELGGLTVRTLRAGPIEPVIGPPPRLDKNGKPKKVEKLACHGCGLRGFDVVLARLEPELRRGYATILVGPNGEVVPVGEPAL
jgi:hypothetical protein